MIDRMQRLAIALPFAASLFAVGCSHGSSADSPVPLGARGELGYHVRAGAASEVPGDEVGFVVTANGQGGYRLAWVAVDGSLSSFSGTASSDGVIDPASIAPFSGRENIQLSRDGRTLDFSSVPSGAADGLDFVPSADPIYVDLRIDGAAAQIFFTGADTSRLYLSQYNPVAFTSP
ncbi:MAG: hypothetical protein JWM53_4469 [bacterium]|nr:hypothetical protein [bacterium]